MINTNRNSKVGELTFSAGALIRRSIRRSLMDVERYGITFREEKGLLDSMFYVRGKVYQLDSIKQDLEDWFRD